MLPGRRAGKLPAAIDHQGVGLMRRALAGLPPAPAATHWSKGGEAWPMFANGAYGCCTASSQATVALHLSRRTGTPIIWPDDAVLALYQATSGWVPGDPTTDQGAELARVFATMAGRGEAFDLPARELLTLGIGIDHTDLDALCQAVATFGAVVGGWQLTRGMAEATDGRWRYDPASPADEGHAAPIVDYRTGAGGREFKVITWGGEVWADEACLRGTMDEAWLPVSQQHWMRPDGTTPLGQPFAEALGYAKRLG